MTAAHAEIAERLEKCSGPDRELDEAIARDVLEWQETRDGDVSLYWSVEENGHISHMHGDPVPYFTASLDAALTLVPEEDGWWSEIHHRSDSPGVVLHQFPLPCRRIPEEKPYQIGGRTTAIALCIAALKARGEA